MVLDKAVVEEALEMAVEAFARKVVEKVEEEAIEWIWIKQIQVSSRVLQICLWNLTWLFQQQNLARLVMMPEPLLVHWKGKELEVSSASRNWT